jgi:hypothetical protein
VGWICNPSAGEEDGLQIRPTKKDGLQIRTTNEEDRAASLVSSPLLARHAAVTPSLPIVLERALNVGAGVARHLTHRSVVEPHASLSEKVCRLRRYRLVAAGQRLEELLRLARRFVIEPLGVRAGAGPLAVASDRSPVR